MIYIMPPIKKMVYNRTMKITTEWHIKNRMPKNPTLDERVAWHLDHAKNCSCRPLDGKILEEIKKRKLL